MFDTTGFKVSDSARRGCWKEAECDGKTAYPSKAAAIRRIEAQSKRGFKSKRGFRKDAVLTPYHCPHCQSWHVGATILRRKSSC